MKDWCPKGDEPCEYADVCSLFFCARDPVAKQLKPVERPSEKRDNEHG